MSELKEPPCPMSRNTENNKKRHNPPTREVAFATQMHDTTTDMFRIGHISDEGKSFKHALGMLKAQIMAYEMGDDKIHGKKIIPPVDLEIVLIAAHRQLKKRYPRSTPLWAYVRDMTSLGSTSSRELCLMMEWDPDWDVRKTELEYKGVLR